MKLSAHDQVFRNPRICHIDPKRLELDRVLINLFMLLRYNGQRAIVRVGRKLVTIERSGAQNIALVDLIAKHPDKLKGFDQYPAITRRWLETDLLDIVFRGVSDRETIAAPRPLHLDAYRLRNPKHCRDYNAADQLFSMIRYGDLELIAKLRDFLAAGLDPTTRKYDEHTALDLDTLLILRLSSDESVSDRPPGAETIGKEPPLCYGQARLMCDDIWRLLTYKNKVPRHVLIGYLRSIMGLHLGLYMLKLFQLLPGWVNTHQTTDDCAQCRYGPSRREHYSRCLYRPLMLVDMAEDYRTRMAELSRQSADAHYSRISDYVRAVFAMNQLLLYANNARIAAQRLTPIPQALQLLDSPTEGFQAYFQVKINNLFPPDDDKEEETPQEIERIRDMALPPFEKYIELIALKRTGFHRRYLTQLVDELFQKNTEMGAMVQGKARANGRRFHLGSRLLETLIQIAVLEPTGTGADKTFRSHPMPIDEFTRWLEERYGFVIDGSHLPEFADADIRDYEAFRGNVQALKSRLREIGFFTDLSDAYNAQTIRPRYPIDG